MLGASRTAPVVRGRAGPQDKAPWRDVAPPRGQVETAFLRPVVLGETIAPFRLLPPALAVLPIVGRRLLDAGAAMREGHRHLARWMQGIEATWTAHCAKRSDGTPRLTLQERLDYMHGLTEQFGGSGPRVVYAKAGTLPAAAIVEDASLIIDHMAYWMQARSVDEARYVCALINSEALRGRVADMQSKGQGGARHFDNLFWEFPIPEYSRTEARHRALAAAAAEAEQAAAAIDLNEAAHFTGQRRAIRDALIASGIAARIDALVEDLLEGA